MPPNGSTAACSQRSKRKSWRWRWHATEAKFSAAQNNQRQKLKPLLQRLLPLAVSGAVLLGLYCLFSFFVVEWPHNDRVLLVLLCYIGGVVLVEAAESAIEWFKGLHTAVAHFRASASTYMASFVIIVAVVPQDVYSGAGDLRSSLAVLACGFLVHHVAPLLGGHQPEGGVSPRPAQSSDDGHSLPSRQWRWRAAKKCIPAAVGVLLSTAATLVTGGGWLLGLEIAGAAWAAFQEMRLAIREGWRETRETPSSTQAISLQSVVTWFTSGPTRRVWSSVLLPTLLLWVTYRTVCSWPEECTDWLVFLLKASATTVCTTHLMQQTVREAVASAQDNGSSGSTTWANKAFVCLRCVCCVAAWTLLLLCSFTVLGHQESFSGILAVVFVVTMVAFRTRCERTWRGLMLVFSVTLLAIMVRVACVKLFHIFEVFKRVTSNDVVSCSWWSRFIPRYFHRFVQGFKDFLELREQERADCWSVCH
ncbi:unnamed protein product [Ectocarpus sp. CCAP 1310/34]|nr:unnamed protein product [Ectocarpus sp. CCAP 1310/34]